VALENLALIYGETQTESERKQMALRCCQHFALLVLDIIWFSFFCRSRLRKWVHWDPSTEIMFADEAQLMLTAHYGNWETLGQAYADRGQPIFSVAAPLKNQSADKVFIHLRQKTGQVIIPQQGAARRLLQGLRNHRKVAVLLDQNTKPKDGGIFVNFMGRPVPVSSAPAALAVKTGATLCTVMAVPDARGLYTVRVYDHFKPDPKAEDPVQALTQRMTDSVVKVIHEQPEFWCWMYKRWRLAPETEDLNRYPSYARHIDASDLKPPRASS
jgi:KDO2-lipid IV(A) lauroyltransferase